MVTFGWKRGSLELQTFDGEGTVTEKEALQEAQRRWGDKAEVIHCPLSKPNSRFRVWNGAMWPYGERYFFGDSFEAAFAHADRKEAT